MVAVVMSGAVLFPLAGGEIRQVALGAGGEAFDVVPVDDGFRFCWRDYLDPASLHLTRLGLDGAEEPLLDQQVGSLLCRVVDDRRVVARTFPGDRAVLVDSGGASPLLALADDIAPASSDGGIAAIRYLDGDRFEVGGLEVDGFEGVFPEQAIPHELWVDRDGDGRVLVVFDSLGQDLVRLYQDGASIAGATFDGGIRAAALCDDGTGDAVLVQTDGEVVVIERRAADLVTVRWSDRVPFDGQAPLIESLGFGARGEVAVVIELLREGHHVVRVLAP